MVCSCLYNFMQLSQKPFIKSYLSNKNGTKRYMTSHMKKAVDEASKPKQHLSNEKSVKHCRNENNKFRRQFLKLISKAVPI